MDKMWNVKCVNSQDYSRMAGPIKNVFNSDAFVELNKGKVDKTEYLLICKGDSVRFAMPVGYRNEAVFCPFSAPFSYPEACKANLGVENFEEAATVLTEYLEGKRVQHASITLPPDFYDRRSLTAWKNALFYQGWAVDTIDINFAFDLAEVSKDYESHLAHNAKKNLRIAMDAGLQLKLCETQQEKELAYNIIKENRASKGYPLRMTLEQVMETIQVVKNRMYIVSSENEYIASALIYDVTNSIAQVVYWGDIPGHSDKKVINYLAHELIGIYWERGFRYLDIGPSTENGIPNTGLCDFKDGIGCERSVKIKMRKDFAWTDD